MRVHVFSLFLAALLLTGCSSNLNPVNWFGRDDSEAAPQAGEEENPLIPESSPFRREPDVFEGTAIDTVTDLKIERVPGGIIVRATGRSARFGAFDAQLTPRDPDELPVNGVLTYILEAERTETVSNAATTREVIVAIKRTDQELGDTRTIRVEGLQNALERRR